MAITATLMKFDQTSGMQREVDEAEYVLAVLHRMRDAASAKPEFYDPDALLRIDEAIARVEGVVQDEQATVDSAEQILKAA